MPQDEPEATSTPTSVPHLSGRKGIRDNNSVQSPIDSEISRHQYETRSYSKNLERTPESAIFKSSELSPKQSPKPTANRSGSYDSHESEFDSEGEGLSSDGDHEDKYKEQAANSGTQWPIIPVSVVIGLLVLVASLAALYFSSNDDSNQNTARPNLNDVFNSLQNEFKKQDLEFWRSIKVSIQEIPVLDQPRTIIFLYDNKAENTLKRILQRVSEIALCDLTQCSNNAIVIEGQSLNTSEIVNDYGKIITKFQNDLERNGVMIVKNLEKVPGMSAQAFHSFCDDYNPLVKKALILFTLKVKSMPASYPMGFVEDFLLKLWDDIGKDDKFYPLFTRISGTILSVRPE